DCFDRQRCLTQIGQFKELAPAVPPARRLSDRTRLSLAIVEITEASIGVGLQDAGIVGKMPSRVLTATITRVEEHGSWRGGPGKWSVVAYISPQSGGDRLSLRQQRHGRVVSVDAFRGEYVAPDQLDERAQHRGAGADMVGQ